MFEQSGTYSPIPGPWTPDILEVFLSVVYCFWRSNTCLLGDLPCQNLLCPDRLDQQHLLQDGLDGSYNQPQTHINSNCVHLFKSCITWPIIKQKNGSSFIYSVNSFRSNGLIAWFIMHVVLVWEHLKFLAILLSGKHSWYINKRWSATVKGMLCWMKKLVYFWS